MDYRDNKKTNDSGLWLLVLLAAVSIVPTFGRFSFRFLGGTFNLYRTTVLIAPLVYFATHRFYLTKVNKALYGKWCTFIVWCLMYGTILLFYSSYVVKSIAIKDLISFLSGLIVISVFAQFTLSEYEISKLMHFIRIILVMLLIVGLVEILTGQHTRTSIYSDPNNLQSYQLTRYRATGFSYNVNDYSALITCLYPSFIYEGRKKYSWPALAVIFLINTVNDAATCNIALIVCIILQLTIDLYVKMSKRTRLLYTLVLPIILLITLYFVLAIDNFVFNYTGNSLIRTIAAQFGNNASGFGSLHSRITMYSDAISASVHTFFTGTGPGSYTNYFQHHPSTSGLVNPHNLFLEILMQYGGIALLIFLYACLSSINYVFETLEHTNASNRRALTSLCILSIYPIASIAPSAFLGYPYQWLLIALVCILLDNSNVG